MLRRIDWPKLLDKLIPALIAALLAALGVPVVTQVSGCGRLPPAPPPDTRPAPPGPGDPPAPPPEATDPMNAIGKIAMQGGYCSGTVIAPRRADGRWTIVSAAHCFKRVGERVTFLTRTGRSFPATVVAIDRRADGAILTTDDRQDGVAFAELAEVTPPVGSPIWHAGYGVHKPGNVETGRVLAAPNGDGQTRYFLSVSSGDSGGGIMLDAGGKLLSPVCCTDRLSGPGNVWGASPEALRRMIASPTNYIDLPPVAMPPAPKIDP